jgi:formate dehydrogenase assembly factor FdhD
VRVNVVEDKRMQVRSDVLSTEEPMEVRVVDGVGQQQDGYAITMRTPVARLSNSRVGFLFAEGVITSAATSRGSTTAAIRA